ncbi:TldD/PmbA family protein [Candidatus Aciduliprofundum boonei]|uniref:Peptidase U62 modulator of DNA gyrase n=1 Tax=Aciduliprofundum boonei (strain DSM 19572 / T469) TaxID=439481 RepID=B5ICG4_ACIB4|nr:TldD/PmbA family protein [Candidatus Aciduliprofundum boonei]ADD09040.1 peptidase U62 modulator of DNA gyrase [Aciduliprofundum boonei T469]EDY35944.1 TldD/PmbA family [Aciduliprofundum boonei T469]HII54445.1 TldD/PmbA family protein [Candidatus Aciduliprofundum boonei]
MDLEKIMNKAQNLGIDEASLILIEREKRQVRFSNNDIDISKLWVEKSLEVFLSKGKKVFMTTIKNLNKAEELIEKYARMLQTLPENKDFYGLNPKKQNYRNRKIDYEILDLDLENLAKEVIDGAIEKGAIRAAGVVYRDYVKREILTNYNSAKDEVANVDIVIRAFNEYRNAGQEAITTADAKELEDAKSIGERAGVIASLGGEPKDGEEGKYKILFHPLAFGSLISYSMHMASAFAVDAGMSFFAGKIGEKVYSEKLTIYDDPTLFSTGYRIFDQEATATQKTPIVEKGVVKNYLHSYSTAHKFNTDTTGNAGILNPNAWQPVVKEGNKSYQDLLSEIDKGLFIINLWYTRFQDYRNGDFSTIPRDGIFYIENGEIKESWKGIRVTENMPHIFSNIVEVSKEREKVKWWDEVLPSYLPYILVDGVNITRSKL